MRHIAIRQVAVAVLLPLVTRIVGVPLANSKETNGHHDDGMATTGLNQLTTDDATYGDGKPAGSSNPQKRGASPLLYREAELRNDYSGNSIPQNGVWEDVEVPLAMPYPGDLFDDETGRPQRTYDVLQRLLLHRNPQPLNGMVGPVSGGGGFPLRLHAYGDRKKRTPGPLKAHSHGHRPKRNSNKLSPAEVFSLLALMDSRDSYRPLSALPEYMPDPPNDVLAYGPSGLYQDVPLPLALEQLLTERDEMPTDGFAYEDAGEWMNGWTEPSVDYLGLPMGDVEALGQLKDGFFSKPPGPKTGYLPQKRYMVSKKKRSAGAGCKAGDPSCSFQGTRYGTIQAAA
ncbi:uncharacterized protein LOC131211610 [Anopheles bellator]|uniref:uncharacterized protein LOC131211610 n=1 Tax=Anopheles bellator TaxID=139047 RepID=UPI002647BB7A|nr:uncharacterized protein LOC131211610 [Anopheles bellator]